MYDFIKDFSVFVFGFLFGAGIMGIIAAIRLTFYAKRNNKLKHDNETLYSILEEHDLENKYLNLKEHGW